MAWAILASAIALYLGAFLWLGPNVGAMLTALYTLPCLAAGWGFGLSGGIMIALLLAPLDAWLLSAGYVSHDGLVCGPILGVLAATITGGGIGLARDLRERLHETGCALEESAARHHLLAQHARDGAFVLHEGRVALASRALARILGAPGPEALDGRPLESLAPIEQREALRARLTTAALGTASEMDATLTRVDGGEVSVRLTVAPIAHQGAPAAMVLVHERVARGDVRIAASASR